MSWFLQLSILRMFNFVLPLIIIAFVIYVETYLTYPRHKFRMHSELILLLMHSSSISCRLQWLILKNRNDTCKRIEMNLELNLIYSKKNKDSTRKIQHKKRKIERTYERNTHERTTLEDSREVTELTGDNCHQTITRNKIFTLKCSRREK